MATIDDAAAIAQGIDGVTEGERHGNRTWYAGGRAFAWERPYSKADLRRFGDRAHPEEPILAIRVDDLHEKEAILAQQRPGVFTIEHFNGYPAVLVELAKVRTRDLRELLTDAGQT